MAGHGHNGVYPIAHINFPMVDSSKINSSLKRDVQAEIMKAHMKYG
jgi:hypothetical protein